MSDWNARIVTASGGDMKAARFRPSAVPLRSSGVAPLVSTSLDRWALARMQRSVTSAPIRFVLWDGFELPSMAGGAVATILFKNRSALFGWVWDLPEPSRACRARLPGWRV